MLQRFLALLEHKRTQHPDILQRDFVKSAAFRAPSAGVGGGGMQENGGGASREPVLAAATPSKSGATLSEAGAHFGSLTLPHPSQHFQFPPKRKQKQAIVCYEPFENADNFKKASHFLNQRRF